MPRRMATWLRGALAMALAVSLLAVGPATRTLASEAAVTLTATVAVAGEVAGRITDSSEQPITGAMVEVFQVGRGLMAVARSDADGRYRAPLADTQVLRVQATAPGFATVISAPLTPNQSAAVDLRLSPVGRVVSGTVRDAMIDKPLRGARVLLTGGGQFRIANTDAAGAFAVPQVPTGGAVQVLATAVGYYPQSVAAGTDLGVKLLPSSLGPVAATGTIAGTVQAEHRPLTGATVRVMRLDTGDIWSTETDLLGRFRLASLPAGPGVRLLAWAEVEGAAPETLDPFELGPDAVTTQNFALAPDSGRIRGNVTAAGSPVAGATVYLFWSGTGAVAATVSDEAGAYFFADVPAAAGGAYWVRAVADGFLPGGLTPAGAVPEPAAVPAGGELVLDVGLQAGAAAFDADPPAVGLDLQVDAALQVEGEVADSSPLQAAAWVNGEAAAIVGGRFRANMPVLAGAAYLVATAQDQAGNLGGAVVWLRQPMAATVTVIRLTIGRNFATVNGRPRYLDPAPVIMGGRTMVPLRWLGEALGAQVGYDAGERKVTYTLGGRTVELWIDKTSARVGNQETQLDAAPVIVQGRTMVPLRFVGSALGARVQYEAADQSITLTYPE